MNKNKWIAVIVCLALTAAAFIGSTGLFYATYRAIRNYDLVAFFASWAGLIYFLYKDRNRD
ncbi:hypothetical protein [Diaphorobacter ruginosibacter]|uniref:hypothetical protein n=1 Tax=Diaphorobacter ruginosibacter TaxID=1715720 RepID=UPI00333F07DD